MDRFAAILTDRITGRVRGRIMSDEATLEAVYDQHAAALYRYALALTSSSEDAEDAVQEVFTRLARERKRLQDVRMLKAYLYTATRNAAYAILRSRKRRAHLQESICAVYEPNSDENSEESILLCQTLSELPREQREVLVLKVFDGLTFKEIAHTIGASANTVASRYRYGIEKLRQALEDGNNG